MTTSPTFTPGDRINHPEFGAGVVIEPPHEGYLRAFFSGGERRVPLEALQRALSRTERILRNVQGDTDRARRAWLALEAHTLPIMESASALTSARIDLLPHQVVLTHRIATTSPRRRLIADEVGLGKTIETALILRELASRGELERALMVVPAGLVNNWHWELNDVFHLDFEVFGSEGDITDRKTNAFAKHDRIIASIDTLKRPARIKRLLEAPRWDLVVFDEAHHLSAYREGNNRIRRTENYKLAEALKNHSRDLLLLSATPHQGNHFQFWMLAQLLDPSLFRSVEDMVENRHRLNAILFRRTKADACRPDGSALFARRWVHTESFVMNADERAFYNALREYLEDGFDLARRQGNQGRALGFLMAIFQKIAASSFAAVRRTLQRRLLTLTLHEALLRDRALDIDGREQLYDEARALIRNEYRLNDDLLGRGETDRIMADLKYRLAKKINEDELALAADPYGHAEDLAAAAVNLHLPEERLRIRALLALFPPARETKVQKLLDGLGALWRRNPQEKLVVFATYLGTVDLLGQEIEAMYPGQGVTVLRGGDHGAKLAAERRFRQPDGPRVLVCTAAGREGINLQFSRILFNFDLPWNPMEVEQRIGRIHRYGQRDTAQVYNLVLSRPARADSRPTVRAAELRPAVSGRPVRSRTAPDPAGSRGRPAKRPRSPRGGVRSVSGPGAVQPRRLPALCRCQRRTGSTGRVPQRRLGRPASRPAAAGCGNLRAGDHRRSGSAALHHQPRPGDPTGRCGPPGPGSPAHAGTAGALARIAPGRTGAGGANSERRASGADLVAD